MRRQDGVGTQKRAERQKGEKTCDDGCGKRNRENGCMDWNDGNEMEMGAAMERGM